jgi:CHAT domain-containing protein
MISVERDRRWREAKAWLRDHVDEPSGQQRYSHPQHWAGWVLIGDPD